MKICRNTNFRKCSLFGEVVFLKGFISSKKTCMEYTQRFRFKGKNIAAGIFLVKF